jgi:hypothetical protein
VGGQQFELGFDRLVLVKAGSQWRYLDDGSSLPESWVSLNFDDSKWKVGPAALGFGDFPVTTIDADPPHQHHITAFFRQLFEVDNPSFFNQRLLRLKHDDGATVYLNGTEVPRANLDGKVTSITPATRDVTGLERDVFFPFPLQPALLRTGQNIVAVEVYLCSPESTDLNFDLELTANAASTDVTPAPADFPPDVAFTSPKNGALFQVGQTIPIAVEAIDSDGQVQSVSLFADGKLVGTDYGPRSPFTFQWRGASLGSHRLRAVVVDDNQRSATADITMTVVANVPPTVELTQPKRRCNIPGP